MKTYIGQAPHRVIVQLANGKIRELDPCLGIREHSPTGFSWGYAGSGPSQLALALCMDAFGKRGAVYTARALRVYQELKFRVVATLPGDRDWELTEDQICATIDAIERERATVDPSPQTIDLMAALRTSLKSEPQR
jgi:hypothetical protein